MSHYSYLIIGGGMAADAAFRGIREVDQNDSIGLIGADPHPPYNRPPLSKGLWKGAPLEEIWRRTEGQNVELHLGREARSLDPQNKRVADDRGAVYSFDKLLLAAALATNGREVVMIFPEEGIGARLFPHDLAGFLNNYYREKGIAVLSEESVAGLERRGDQLVLKSRNARTSSRREVEVEAVVAGIGIQPNVELAQAAGLKVGNGIVVDELLRTSHPDIYAAGDVASFHNPALGGQEKPTRALRQWPTGRSRTARA